jgi:hypothetical protein
VGQRDRGLRTKRPSSLVETEEADRGRPDRRQWTSPAPSGTAAAGERGKTERRTTGTNSPSQLGLRWHTKRDRWRQSVCCRAALEWQHGELGSEIEMAGVVYGKIESEGVALL